MAGFTSETYLAFKTQQCFISSSFVALSVHATVIVETASIVVENILVESWSSYWVLSTS